MYTVCDKNYVEDEFRFVFICPLQVSNQSFVCVSVWWPARLVLNIQELSFFPDGAVMNIPYW